MPGIEIKIIKKSLKGELIDGVERFCIDVIKAAIKEPINGCKNRESERQRIIKQISQYIDGGRRVALFLQ